MTNNDFMLTRKSGTPPVKLLFDKSLMFGNRSIYHLFSLILPSINNVNTYSVSSCVRF